MQSINEDRQQIIPPQKRLFSKENHIDNIFIYSTINIKVLSHTILSVYREEEHIIDWSQFGSLDKVDFFKQANNMICAEVVKTTNTKIRLKESLNKVEGPTEIRRMVNQGKTSHNKGAGGKDSFLDL